MSPPKKRQPGRPNTGRTEYIEVRVSPEEKERYADAAQHYGISLSDWVRLTLSAMSAPENRKPIINRN
jgi:predicted HicB family RNase H-like nuclease